MLFRQRKKVLVVGDFMLDVYTFGEVRRISPEAPVPVLRVIEESNRPGGAGNTALNLVSLEMDVSVLGRVGHDKNGEIFTSVLKQEGIDISGLIQDPYFHTPVKNRMICSGQQMLRVDYEKVTPLSAEVEDKALMKYLALLEHVDIVAIADSAHGFLTPSLLNNLMHSAREKNIPVIVDPKSRDFSRYKGATLLKPNLSEAIAAAGLHEEATLDEIAFKILEKTGIEVLVVTRSHEGISVFRKNERHDYPAHVHEVKDVTGAGDTVLAVITKSFASQAPLPIAAKLANIAAGKAIERIGCARISLEELKPHLLELGHDFI